MAVSTFEDLYKLCADKKIKIYEAAQEYEADNSGISVGELRNIVKKSLDAMKESIKCGMASEEMSPSGLSGNYRKKLQDHYTHRGAIFGRVFEKMTSYALAISEENSRMGKIAACPTAGSCAIVPSVLITVAERFKIPLDEQINALITAGEIGRIISNKISLAGAVGGCQAECGVAAAMSAGALTQMLDGTIDEIFNAVALALKNVLGLTCDPVCGLVEVPCIKRNCFLAVHAVTASELARAGINSQIPLDEVVDALEQTGYLMSPMLKESSQAGLAKTKTALMLEKRLNTKLSR